MSVRWPRGRQRVYELHDKFQAEVDRIDAGPDLAQFHAAVELFYPASHRGAGGRVPLPENAAREAITPEEADKPGNGATVKEPEEEHPVDFVGRPFQAVSEK